MRGEGEDLYALQQQLREVMWEHVGLIRHASGLKAALREIEDIGHRAPTAAVPGGTSYNLAWQDWLNLQNQAAAAWLIARSALERAESRGSHFRSDHPETGADLYNVLIASDEAAGLRVWTEPVRLTASRPLARSRPASVGDERRRAEPMRERKTLRRRMGSAEAWRDTKTGMWAWLLQRVAAVGLLAVIALHLKNPFLRTVQAALLGLVLLHGVLGVRSIVIDVRTVRRAGIGYSSCWRSWPAWRPSRPSGRWRWY